MEDKVNVTNQVINYIHKNIESGAWPVGKKMPSENELCKELGVSRVSIRTALQQYIAFGILKSVHGKGSFVLTNDLSAFGHGKTALKSVDDLEQVLEFRRMIEPEIASIAAQNAIPETIQQLSKLLDEMRNAVGDTESFVRYDMMFHQELCKTTGNTVVQSVMADIFSKKLEAHLILNQAVGYYGGMYYHTLMLDAIKRHDGKRAKTLMYEHLQMSMSELTIDSVQQQNLGVVSEENSNV